MKLGIYRHYRGQVYQVLCVARHEVSHEELVIYQALYGDFSVWARPQSMFAEQLLWQGRMVARFEYIGAGMTEIGNLK